VNDNEDNPTCSTKYLSEYTEFMRTFGPHRALILMFVRFVLYVSFQMVRKYGFTSTLPKNRVGPDTEKKRKATKKTPAPAGQSSYPDSGYEINLKPEFKN